ncbi:uncharacterized protein LOC129238770 isoform X2 [Anastrepha obliqua]|uniref:uncharacterized protein LOC129238770 isoform X2 n=1 Tax=Anastrepha obliqua TaxID=95512 RepID=UPI00240A51BE|nr:uncharacterized protein LOC129238770 isoform X2 [Anastrepha obliqua]
MPTRPYKQKVCTKSNDGDSTNDNNSPGLTKRGGDNLLDRLLLHNSDDLKLRERHCLFPAFNVSQKPLNGLNELRWYPECAVSTPCPIYIAEKHCGSVDICHRRTMARDIYRKRLNTSRTRYHTVQKDKRLRTNEKKGSYYTSVFDLAKRLECDPDPYFHGSYDYYYTGGNLCVMDDGSHVLHVDNENLDNINVGALPKFTSFSNGFLDHISSQQLNTDSEIFELRPIRNLHVECSNCFAVRTRNTITLHTLLPTGTTKGVMRFKTNSTPFISFAQSTVDSSTFIVTTMKQSVRVYDLNTSTPVLSAQHDVCTRDDINRVSWNMVRPWQGQTFVYANEKKLLLIDTRTTPDQWLKSSCGYETPEYKCDFISSIAKSEYRDLVYVATNHKLHCLDLRYIGGDFESSAAAICRWTHQLQYAPAFVETFHFGGVEFIALSSALADDMVICELTREHSAQIVNEEESSIGNSPGKRQFGKCEYKSYCLPYQLPTLQEAYHKARVAGKCLQPDADLTSRMARCTTGLAFYDTETSECIGKEDSDTFALLLTSNSIGDVYARRLIARDTQEVETCKRDENAGEDTMHVYADRVCERTQKNLNCTEVVNLRAMRKVFRCNALSNPINFEDGDDDDDDKAEVKKISRKRHALGRWQKPVEALYSYKDALVKDLLSIWDIDYEDNKKYELSFSHIKKRLGAEPNPEGIVSSWLEENIKVKGEPQTSSAIKQQSEQLEPQQRDLPPQTVSSTIKQQSEQLEPQQRDLPPQTASLAIKQQSEQLEPQQRDLPPQTISSTIKQQSEPLESQQQILPTQTVNSTIKQQSEPLESQQQILPPQSVNSAIKQHFEQFDSTTVAMVHVPCADVNQSIKMETSFHFEDDTAGPNNSFLSEFMPYQHSTQLINTISNMPDSPTEQEEFISLAPKKKPAKKKSKYVKGF